MAQRPKSFAFGTGASAAPRTSGLRRFFSELSLTNLVLVAMLALAILGWAGLFALSELASGQLAERTANISALVDNKDFSTKEQALNSLHGKVVATHGLFTKQVLFSGVFNYLEKYTHRQVQWLSADLNSKAVARQTLSDDEVKSVAGELEKRGQADLKTVSGATNLAEEVVLKHFQTLASSGWARKIDSQTYAFLPATQTMTLNGVANGYQALAEQLVALTKNNKLAARAYVSQLGLSQDGGVSFSVTVDVLPELFMRANITPQKVSSLMDL